MAYLARQDRDRLVPIHEIGDNVNVATPVLAKILARLSRNGLLSTRRGPHGGVMLSRPPGEVSLQDVVRLFHPARGSDVCYLGLKTCDGRRSCPVHAVWRQVQEDMDRVLNEKTLADLRRIRLDARPKRDSRS